MSKTKVLWETFCFNVVEIKNLIVSSFKAKNLFIILFTLFTAYAIHIRYEHSQIGVLAYNQHDPHMHHSNFGDAMQLRVRGNFNGPWYYLFVAIPNIPFEVFNWIKGMGLKYNTPESIAFGHWFILTFIFVGFYAFMRELKYSQKSSFVMAVVSISLPVIQRSMSMLRPENFILMLFPWAALALLKYESTTQKQNKNLWAGLFSIFAAFAIAQKITGFSMVGVVWFLVLAFYSLGKWRSRLKAYVNIMLKTLLITVALLCIHRVMGGKWFYEHNAIGNKKYYNKPKADIFFRVNPVTAYQTPFRDNHANSMINIMMIDFFGDYWMYGTNHYRFKNPKEIALWQARVGVLLSIALSLFILLGIIYWIRNLDKAKPTAKNSVHKSIPFIMVFVGAVFTLAVSAFANQYHPGKFDLIKNEYSLWALPLLFLPLIYCMEISKGRSKVFFEVVLAVMVYFSLVQATIFKI